MKLSRILLTLLTIFCLIVSAGVVCAADNGDNLGTGYADDMGGYAGSQYQDDGGWAGSQYEDDGGYAGSQYQDEGGWAGSQYEDDGGWTGSQYNETLENSYASNSSSASNATNNTHEAAAGEPTNTTTNMTVDTTPSHKMLATGNPVVLLLGVCAVAGGYVLLRRKN